MLQLLGRGLSRAYRVVPVDISDKTVALFGDSIAFQNTGVAARFEAYGYMTTLNVMTGQRFNFTHDLNQGVSGNTTTQMAARLSDLSGLGAHLVVVQGGTNDIIGKASPSTITANLATIYSYVTGTLGAKVIALPITPRSYWPGFSAGEITQGKADINTVNAWIRSQASGNIIVADCYDAWNAGNDEPYSDYTYDGLHPSLIGAYYMAQALYDTLVPLYGVRGFTLQADNILTNTDFSGTGGAAGSNAAGQVADSHTVETTGTTSSAARTFSKSSGQKIDFSFSSGLSATEAVRLYQNVAGQSGAVGKTAYYEVELEILSGTGNWYTISAELRNSAELSIGYDRRDNATNAPISQLISFEGSAGRKLLLRSPAMAVPAGTTNLRGRVNIETNCTSAAASGSVRLTREQLRVY